MTRTIDPDLPTVVLVHGAWADASSWNEVVKRLHRDGYPVIAAPNPLRGIAADSAYISGLLAAIEGPIVLVAHSYGGFVITNAATGNGSVKALVFVDAFAPDSGESIASLTGAVPGSELAGDAPTLFRFAPIANGGGDVDLFVLPEVFEHAFGNHLSVSVAETLASTQRPLTASTIQEESGAPAWKDIPSWYVVGTDDRVIPAGARMAQRAGSTVTRVTAGHLSMVSEAKAVAKVIVAASRVAVPATV